MGTRVKKTGFPGVRIVSYGFFGAVRGSVHRFLDRDPFLIWKFHRGMLGEGFTYKLTSNFEKAIDDAEDACSRARPSHGVG